MGLASWFRKILSKHATHEESSDEEDTKTGEFGDKSKRVYFVGTIATIRVRRIAHSRGVYSEVTIKIYLEKPLSSMRSAGV